jgi:DNA mismatch repair protein MutL
VPESIGQPVPPPWAQSLPLGFAIGPGEAFDEFSPRVAADTAMPPRHPAPHDAPAIAGICPSAANPAALEAETVPALAEACFRPIESAEQAVHEGRLEPRPPLREPAAPPLKAIQVHDSYLIAETGDGMMVIDQHALHERILYEELRTRVAEGRIESQRLLVPEPVDLPAAEAAALVEQSELLEQLGLEVEPFGGDTVLVRSMPAMLPRVVPEHLVRDLAEHFRTEPLPPTRDGLLAELLHMVACKAAVKAGQPLSPPEIAALLERRHLVADSHHCPHGRPTALVFTKADLEKQFRRT